MVQQLPNLAAKLPVLNLSPAIPDVPQRHQGAPGVFAYGPTLALLVLAFLTQNAAACRAKRYASHPSLALRERGWG